ncbi:glutathione peroxidase [Anaerosporobacter sp.]|uniref:glutathione peroxidase n=1 Tax=Anaerosporobacter sp. TaxID=1872529 RepID=UPI00286F9117|nr:glutathione peroxidase [Anaerosporobacter sp.]
MNVYDFLAKNANGETIHLKDYEGKVLLIINTATECGFTPQYDDLQDLYEQYQSSGLEILDFPCNQFGNQAPGSDEEIVSFCDSRFGITFPHFAKIDVNGEHALPLYMFLQNEKSFSGFDSEHPLTPIIESVLERTNPSYKTEADIKWNFTKFLIDRSGNVVERFEPTERMDVIEEKMRELL